MSYFEDKYKAEKLLGRGAYGKVTRVQSLEDGLQYADKQYLHDEPDYNEINIASSFDHPNARRFA
jgi:hypothetical protein